MLPVLTTGLQVRCVGKKVCLRHRSTGNLSVLLLEDTGTRDAHKWVLGGTTALGEDIKLLEDG